MMDGTEDRKRAANDSPCGDYRRLACNPGAADGTV